MATRRKKAAKGGIPQSPEEANRYLEELGRLERERETLTTTMNTAIATARATAETADVPKRTRIAALVDGLTTWADTNRTKLTNDGNTKTATLSAGTIKWRWTTPKVTLKKPAEVIEALKAKKLPEFIKTTEAVAKDPILAAVAAAKQIDQEKIANNTTTEEEKEVLRIAAAIAGIKGIKVARAEEIVIEAKQEPLSEVTA